MDNNWNYWAFCSQWAKSWWKKDGDKYTWTCQWDQYWGASPTCQLTYDCITDQTHCADATYLSNDTLGICHTMIWWSCDTLSESKTLCLSKSANSSRCCKWVWERANCKLNWWNWTSEAYIGACENVWLPTPNCNNDKITIHYDANGWQWTMTDQVVECGEPFTLKKNTYTNGSSEFDYWKGPAHDLNWLGDWYNDKQKIEWDDLEDFMDHYWNEYCGKTLTLEAIWYDSVQPSCTPSITHNPSAWTITANDCRWNIITIADNDYNLFVYYYFLTIVKEKRNIIHFLICISFLL